MKYRLIAIFLLINIIVPVNLHACTVIYAFKDGIIFGGNNEDWEDPITKMWIYPDKTGKHGWIKFGFGGGYPQGGMNDQGLFWDATAGPYLEMPLSEANKTLYPGSLMQKVTEECSNIAEACDIFKDYYCEDQYKAQYLVGDSFGHSMIVEGDNIIKNDFGHQVLTNFYQSHPELGGYPCWRYETAKEQLDTCQVINPFTIGTILAHTYQEGKYPTQYSNIYDLKNGIVYLFYFHNFHEFIQINLLKEIERGFKEYSIPGLFSKMSMLSPQNDESVTSTSLKFKWMGLPKSSYEIQYSQSPSFDDYNSITISPTKSLSHAQISHFAQRLLIPVILMFFTLNIFRVRKNIIPVASALFLAAALFACTKKDTLPIDYESPIEFSEAIEGLSPGFRYYWRIIASNSNSEHFVSETTVRSFTTVY